MTTLPKPQESSKLSQRSTIALIVGDIIAFLVFASIGRSSHNESAGAAEILHVAETAAPFIIGWFIVALFAGTYRANVVQNWKPMLTHTALAWLIAWPIGLALRAIIRQSGIPLSFALVTLGAALLILLIWRTLFATVLAKRLD